MVIMKWYNTAHFKIGRVCSEHGVPLLVDAAQTLVSSIDVVKVIFLCWLALLTKYMVQRVWALQKINVKNHPECWWRS